MPQVPGLIPEVSPSSGGTPNLSVAAPVDAFGGAVGHALSQLGEHVNAAGDKIWQRAVELQNLENDTQAKNADTAYMIKAGMLHADFGTLEGSAAKAAFPKYMKDLQDARENVRGSLTNPMQQKMYDASSISTMGRTIFNGAGHAAQQSKVAASNASTSRVATVSDTIGANPDDEVGFQRGIRAIKAETAGQGELHGWSPDQTAETTSANVSTAVSKRIVGLARTDPFTAQTMFDRASKGGNLLPNDAAKVQATIQTQSRQAIPRGISSEINADLEHPAEEGVPQKSLEDRLAEGAAKAETYAKNDPLLQDFVKQRIIADYSRSKAVQRDANYRNINIVDTALMTGNKDGDLPTSADQLKLINPEVSQAWDALPPSKQLAFMGKFKRNAMGERVAETPETLRTYQGLIGLAAEDPVAFLAKDITAEHLPTSSMRTLINKQASLTKQSQSDPRVARAMSILAPDINAAGISKAKDPEGYYQFVGGLQDALDQEQQTSKKVPDLETVKKIGARLMQEQVTSKGWLWDSKAPLYSIPVPEEDATRIKAEPIWQQRGIAKPTEAMLQRFYAAEQYRKLYGGSKKAPPETIPGAPIAPVSQ